MEKMDKIKQIHIIVCAVSVSISFTEYLPRCRNQFGPPRRLQCR